MVNLSKTFQSPKLTATSTQELRSNIPESLKRYSTNQKYEFQIRMELKKLSFHGRK